MTFNSARFRVRSPAAQTESPEACTKGPVRNQGPSWEPDTGILVTPFTGIDSPVNNGMRALADQPTAVTR